MKIIVKNDKEVKLNKFIDWLLYMVGYTIVVTLVDQIFNSFDVENIWYGFIAVLLIYILNKTIKPLIVRLTIPITALTFGLFYPFINLFILKLVDFILGSHFQIYGIWSGILIAVVISIMNYIMEEFIIKPIIRKCDNE